MELKGKKVLVFGAGKSGIGAADLLNAVGACPVLYDGKADLDKESVLHKSVEIMNFPSMQESCRRKFRKAWILWY